MVSYLPTQFIGHPNSAATSKDWRNFSAEALPHRTHRPRKGSAWPEVSSLYRWIISIRYKQTRPPTRRCHVPDSRFPLILPCIPPPWTPPSVVIAHSN